VADTAAIIRQNLADVQGRIADAANGRELRLVCVTKYAQDGWVRELLSAGATDLGENLLPLARDRFAGWRLDYPAFTRHLLGAQQSRKAKLIPGACDMFQAVDRPEFAKLLQAVLQPEDLHLDVLIEINIDAEPQKHGFPASGLDAAMEKLNAEAPQLVLRGLMCIPKFRQADETATEFEVRTRDAYSTMAQLFARIRTSLRDPARWDTLSMGMSQDFTWAIEEGATMVRVGSALFAGLEG
jgi:pyridoxal phosphate enzyme (YggS family)